MTDHARQSARLEIIGDLGRRYDMMEIARAPLEDFQALADEYRSKGLYVDGPLARRLKEAQPASDRRIKHDVPEDSRQRILAMVCKQGQACREEMAKELGGISLTALRPSVIHLMGEGLIFKHGGHYMPTLQGFNKYEKEMEHEPA